MIYRLIGIAIRLASSAKSKLFFSIISVSLAVGVMCSTQIIIQSMNHSFDREIKKLYGEMDVMVGLQSGKVLENGQLEKMVEQRGILDYSKVLVNPVLGESYYYVGVDNTKLSKELYKFTVPLDDNQIVLTQGFADKLSASVGKWVTLPTHNLSQKKWKVAEIIPDIRGISAPDVVIFPMRSLQASLGVDGANLVLLNLEDGVDTNEVLSSIEAKLQLPLKSEIVSQTEFVQKNAANLQWTGGILSFLSLSMAIAFIFSNFRLMMLDYLRQLVILQANGANKRQLLTIILTQLILVVMMGSLLGMILSIGLVKGFGDLIAKALSITTDSITINIFSVVGQATLAVCLFILLLMIPIRRAFYRLPLVHIGEASQAEYIKTPKLKKIWIILGLVGLLLQIYGLIASSGSIPKIVSGGLLVFISFLAIVPVLFQKMLASLTRLLERQRARELVLSTAYLRTYANQNRLILYLISLSIAVPLLGLSIYGTIKANTVERVEKEYVSDIVLMNHKRGMSTLPLSLANDIQNIEGVKGFITITTENSVNIADPLGMSGDPVQSFTYMRAPLAELQKRGLLPPLGEVNDAVVLTKKYVDKLNLAKGDFIQLVDPEGVITAKTLKVTAVVKEDLPGSWGFLYGAYVDTNNSMLPTEQDYLLTGLIFVKPGTKDDVLVKLQQFKNQYPLLEASEKDSALALEENQINQRYYLILAIAVVSGVIGLMALYNTLAAFYRSRQRELAILVSLGMSRVQTTRVLLLQTGLFSLMAAIIGVITGVYLSLTVLTVLGGIGETIIISWVGIALGIVFLLAYSFLISWLIARHMNSKILIERLRVE
ncbi:ABC transporter permease [Paenibacillus sp. GCM10012306]|uniref:ABC transporter permease n=1 Tax=Paenibacillus sp. GCM10012306 TaxID=3317342 RepID=UPI00362323AE